jgi:hypothetical protein
MGKYFLVRESHVVPRQVPQQELGNSQRTGGLELYEVSTPPLSISTPTQSKKVDGGKPGKSENQFMRPSQFSHFSVIILRWSLVPTKCWMRIAHACTLRSRTIPLPEGGQDPCCISFAGISTQKRGVTAGRGCWAQDPEKASCLTPTSF